jgi:hypothetical protein
VSGAGLIRHLLGLNRRQRNGVNNIVHQRAARQVVDRLAQAVLKSLYEVIILPVTIRVVKYIKKVDGNDVYDLGTSYNILKVKDI